MSEWRDEVEYKGKKGSERANERASEIARQRSYFFYRSQDKSEVHSVSIGAAERSVTYELLALPDFLALRKNGCL
jgi:hypothetical protein